MSGGLVDLSIDHHHTSVLHLHLPVYVIEHQQCAHPHCLGLGVMVDGLILTFRAFVLPCLALP